MATLSGSAVWLNENAYRVRLTNGINQSGAIELNAKPPVGFVLKYLQEIPNSVGIVKTTIGDASNFITLEWNNGVYTLKHNSATLHSVSVPISTSQTQIIFSVLNSYGKLIYGNTIVFNDIDFGSRVLEYEDGVVKIEGITNASQNTSLVVEDVFLQPMFEIRDDLYVARGVYAEKYFNVDYADLKNKPDVVAQSNADWNSTSGASLILNKPTLAPVATTGSYNDLLNKPSLDSSSFIVEYATEDKLGIYHSGPVIGLENLYTWFGDQTISTSAEPFKASATYTRMDFQGTSYLYNYSYHTNTHYGQYMIHCHNLTQDTSGTLQTPANCVRIRLPCKRGVSHALFLKFLNKDRWSSAVAYVCDPTFTTFQRLQGQTNSMNSTETIGFSSWIGPNGQMSMAPQLYHEWQMFSIPQYWIEQYSYDEINDNKSRYGTSINIAFCSGKNNTDVSSLFLSGIAIRPNPYGLTFHGALALHYTTNGGSGSDYYGHWNLESLNQWNDGNYTNIRVPICPPKDPATNELPDFYLVGIGHSMDGCIDYYPTLYLQNPSNANDVQLLGQMSPCIRGRYGTRLIDNRRFACGVIVPSPDPKYIVYSGGRPYLNIRYDNNVNGKPSNYTSHIRGFFTEVIDKVGIPRGFTPYGSLPISYTSSLTISSSTTNLNLLSYYTTTVGVPTRNRTFYITINSGVVIGSTNANTPALDVGQWPSGCILIITNNGTIQGAGGVAGAGGTVYNSLAGAGGRGGTAIKADYANQAVEITNGSTGVIYGGGGGGGGGSKGAPYEGVGTYLYSRSGSISYWGTYTVVATSDNYPLYQSLTCVDANNSAYINRYTQAMISNPEITSAYFQSEFINGTYYRGDLMATDPPTYFTYVAPNTSSPQTPATGVRRYYKIAKFGTVEGGNGGNGAIGKGYNNTNLSGSVGSANGLNGGNGGDWGQAGLVGGGTFGGAGGGAGYYLVKGSAIVSLTNNGTILGLLS